MTLSDTMEQVGIDDPRLPDLLTVDYTARDFDVVDYDYYVLDAFPRMRFRGPYFDPRDAEPGSFFTTMGSAHTLGALSPVAYGGLLARELGLDHWNVGVGGISTSFYNRHARIVELANKGKFAVLQMTAARMESNERFTSTPCAQFVLDHRHGDLVGSDIAWHRISQEEPESFDRYVAQSRATWVEQHRQLLASLTVPTVLLWLSARPMNQIGEETGQVGSLSHTAFPHFINGEDVAQISDLAAGVVECVTERGIGKPYVSRWTNRPVRINYRNLGIYGPARDLFEEHNSYYATPEMHEDAAQALVPAVRKLSD